MPSSRLIRPPRRLFLALTPSRAARHRLLAQRSLWGWPAGVRLEHASDLHLTLHFIGAVPATRVPELRQRLAVPLEPFELVLDHSDVWRTAGVAVLEASQVPAALLRLRKRLGDALHACGLTTDSRPFRPHLTLARQASGAALPPPDNTVPDAARAATAPRCRQGSAGLPLAWRVTGYALVESLPPQRRDSDEPRYRTLRRYP